MKKNFMMVIAILGIACATLVSCDNGSTTKTEVVYDGPDTTYMNNGFLFFLQNTPDSIVVKSGDNLWDLSMMKWDDDDWYRFMTFNPFLSDPGRVKYEGGKIIVLIYPGEKLDFSGINNVPIPTRLKETVVTITEEDKDEILGLPWWAWLLILLLVFVMLKALLDDARAYRSKNEKPADPVTQGPPVKEGGLTAETVRSNFQEWATRTGRRIGQIFDVNVYSDGRVVPIQCGDRRDRPAPLNGEDAYEVEILNAEGQVTGYKKTLAKCANDIRGGADGLPDYVRSVRKAVQPAVLNQQPVTEQPVIDLRKQTTDQPITKETQPVKEQEKTESEEKKSEEKDTSADMLLKITKEVFDMVKVNGGTIEDYSSNVGKASISIKKLTINKTENPKKDNA